MTFNRVRTGAALAATAVLVAACGGGASPAPTTGSTGGATNAPATQGATQAALSGTVTVDGSSTVYPITEFAAADFQTANPGVQVAVALSGTGGGFQKFCRGETDINDASRPIDQEDPEEGVACETNGVEWVELQIAIDGLSVVVNPANTWATCLTVAELSTIYGPDSPEDLSWADVRAGFPDQPVVRFMPGADSGTFDYFTDEINGEGGLSTSHGEQSEDDNVLVTGVGGDSNAIGYFGYAYYTENSDKVKAIGVDGGDGCVEPTPETINGGTYVPLSRPLFIYPDVGKAKERQELKGFVDFYFDNLDALVTETGYITIPADVLAAERAEWEAAVGS